MPTAIGQAEIALTTRDVESWWGSPDTYQIKDWWADLEVGGRWSLDVMKDGELHPATGVFLEIDAPRRIVFTRRYEWDYPLLGWRDTKVTYLLSPAGSDTRLTIRQDGFAKLGDAADKHVEGWERFLGFLQAWLRKTRDAGATTARETADEPALRD